jgi:small conductance mechanosensitive channel
VGKVADIGLFVTIVNTLDNQKVIIPNGKLTGDVINNINGNGVRRVDMTAGISYDDDMEQAKQICRKIVDEHPKVMDDPAPTVAVFEMADSSVNLLVRPWCKAEDYWAVWFDVTQSIKEEFDRAGISIPYPQRDVHMYQAAASS